MRERQRKLVILAPILTDTQNWDFCEKEDKGTEKVRRIAQLAMILTDNEILILTDNKIVARTQEQEQRIAVEDSKFGIL